MFDRILKLNYQSVILEQSYISASIYRTLSFKKENLMTINTLQCPVSWLYMEYCLEGRFAWWQLAQTKSIRPMCICRSLSLRKRNKHGKTVTADVASKVNSGLSTLPPSTSSNIENWWEGRIDDVITHVTWHHLCKNILVDSNPHKFVMTQNMWKRCCWHCYIWADWFTFYHHIITMPCWSSWGNIQC